MQAYSDPKRADDPHALPNIEVFEFNPARDAIQVSLAVCDCCDAEVELISALFEEPRCVGCAQGWYWQACFPGCLPDSDPVGPFASEAEALADAQSGAGEE